MASNNSALDFLQKSYNSNNKSNNLQGSNKGSAGSSSLYEEDEEEKKEKERSNFEKGLERTLEGVTYLGHRFGLGFIDTVEGTVDYLTSGVAKILETITGNERHKDFYGRVLENDWLNYDAADEWFDPGQGWKFFGDVASGVGQQVYTWGIGALTGGVGLVPAAFFSGAGNAAQEAYKETGKFEKDEVIYSNVMGGIEAGLELFLPAGGAKIAKSIGKSLGLSIAKESAKDVVASTGKNLIKKGLKEFFSEGIEEAFTEFITPYVKRETYDEDAEDATAGEIIYSGIVGGLTGLFGGGIDTFLKQRSNRKAGKEIEENGSESSVLSLADMLSEIGGEVNKYTKAIQEDIAWLANSLTEKSKANREKVLERREERKESVKDSFSNLRKYILEQKAEAEARAAEAAESRAAENEAKAQENLEKSQEQIDNVNEFVDSVGEKIQQGKETISEKAEEITSKLSDGKNAMLENAKDLRNKVSDLIKSLESKATEARENVIERLDDGRKSVENLLNEIGEKAQQNREKAQANLAEGKESISNLLDSIQDKHKERNAQTLADAKKLKETLSRIIDKIEARAKAEVKQAVNDGVDKATDYVEGIKDKASENNAKVKDAVNNGKEIVTNGIVSLSDYFAQTAKNTAKDVKQKVDDAKSKGKDALNAARENILKIVDALENGVKLNWNQKRILGEIRNLETNAIFEPIIKRSALSVIEGAEAVANKLNLDGVFKMVGDKLANVKEKGFDAKGEEVRDITADDIRKGITSERNATFKDSIADALKNNEVLRFIAASDAAGRIMMNAKETEKAAATGTKIKTPAEFSKFLSESSQQEKNALAKELGVEDLDSMSFYRFNKVVNEYRESGKAAKFQEKIRINEQLNRMKMADAEKMPTKIDLKDGEMRRYSDGNDDIAVVRKGKEYIVHDFKSNTYSNPMSKSRLDTLLGRKREINNTAKADKNALSMYEDKLQVDYDKEAPFREAKARIAQQMMARSQLQKTSNLLTNTPAVMSAANAKEETRATPDTNIAIPTVPNTDGNSSAAKAAAAAVAIRNAENIVKQKIVEYDQMDDAKRAKTVNVFKSAIKSGISTNDSSTYARVSARTGLDIVFDKEACKSGNTYYSGYYDPANNRIVVNPETKKRHSALLIHELSHAIRSYTGKDNKIHYLADKNAKISPELWEKVKKHYADQNVEVNRMDLYLDEASAYYAEEILGTDAALDLLLGKKKTLKEKILSFFRGAIKGYAGDEALTREARKFYRSFKKMFDAFEAKNQMAEANNQLAEAKSQLAEVKDQIAEVKDQIAEAKDQLAEAKERSENIRAAMEDFENKKITAEMNDDQRYEILKNKIITSPFYDGEVDSLISDEIEGKTDKFAKKAIITIANKIGIIRSEINFKDVEVKITLSNSNLRESLSKEANPEQVAKLLPVLSSTAENSVLIERHNNRYYYDTDTVYFDNLLGAYVDGDHLVPVRFGLKHSRIGTTTLYVVIDQNKIPLEKLIETKNSMGHQAAAPDSRPGDNKLRRHATYSISQIISFVNSKDLLRYIPDAMLSEKQRTAKWKAIAETIKKTNEKNDKKFAEYISKGDIRSATQMVYSAAKAAGYTDKVYHGTKAFGFTEFDPEKSDDKRSLFAAGSTELAQTYSGKRGIKKLSDIKNIDGLSNEEVAKMLNKEASESYEGAELKTEYEIFTLKDVNDLITEVNDGIDGLQKVIDVKVKEYADKMAIDFNDTDAKTHSRLIEANELLKAYEYKRLSTPLYVLLHYTDAFRGDSNEKEIADLEYKIRLMNKLSDADTANGVVVKKDLDGYGVSVLSFDKAREELKDLISSGNYALYGNPGKQLVIDAKGQNWNNIKNWIKSAYHSTQDTYVKKDDNYYRLYDSNTDEQIFHGRIEINEKNGKMSIDSIHPIMVQKANNNLYIRSENMKTTRDIAKFAKDEGFDSVKFENLVDNGGNGESIEASDVYVYFNPRDLKSADPVTYDDDGNVIPLSERFDTKNPNIRYAVEEESTESPTIGNVAKSRFDEPKPKMKEKIKAGFTSAKDKLYIEGVDELYGVEKYLKKFGGRKDAEAFVQQVRASETIAQTMIGLSQYDIMSGDGTRLGDGISKIFKPYKIRKIEDQFNDYLLHQLNVDRMTLRQRSNGELDNKPVFGKNEKRDHDITAEESKKIIAAYEKKYSSFKADAEKVWSYSKNLLNMRVKAGLISQEAADLMNRYYPHYVPSFRVDAKSVGASAVKNDSQLGVNSTVKRAKGGSSDIYSIEESIAAQTRQAIRAMEINMMANAVYDAAIKSGDTSYVIAEEVETEKNTDPDKDIDVDLIPKNNQIVFFKDGKRIEMNVAKEIFDGFKGVTSGSVPDMFITRMANRGVNAFKNIVTSYSPAFTVRNFVRDLQDAGINSKHSALWAKNIPFAIGGIATNDVLWQQYLAYGGYASTVFDGKGFTNGVGGRGFEALKKWSDIDGNFIKKAPKFLKNILVGIGNANAFVEQVTRFAEFRASIEAGDSIQTAINNSADVTTNFSRHGKSVKVLNATFIPFLNASVQGFDKLVRMLADPFREKSLKAIAMLLAKILVIGVGFQVLNMVMNGDDEEYYDLTDEVRENYFLIKVGDQFIKIPRGRAAAAFGGVANRIGNEMRGDDFDVQGYLTSLKDNVTPVDSFSRNILSPFKDIATNTTWYGGEIEGRQFDNVRPSQRYDESTSSIAIAIAHMHPEAWGVSPKKVHYLLDQYSGVIGDFLLPATTKKAEKDYLSANFLIDSTTNNKLSNDFYKLYDEAMYASEEGDMTAYYQLRHLNDVKESVSKLYEEINEIQNSDLKNAEKLQQVRTLRVLINNIYRTATVDYAAYKKAIEATDGMFDDSDDSGKRDRHVAITQMMYGSEKALEEYNKGVYEKSALFNKAGISYDTFYEYYFGVRDLESDVDKNGEVVEGSKKKKVEAAVKSMGVDSRTRALLLMASGYSVTDSEKRSIASYIKSLDLTEEEFEELAKACGFKVKNGRIQL